MHSYITTSSISIDASYHKPVSTATLDRPPTCTPLGPPFPFLTISVWSITGWRVEAEDQR